MNIPKAIEILKLHQLPTEWDLYNDDVDAIKLGTEALERIKLGRTGVQRFAHSLLPSETKD